MSPALHSAHVALLNGHSRLPTAAQLLVVAAVVVTKWDTLRRTRKSLATLTPEALDDIGVSRAAAKAEAERPFWRS